MHIVFLPIINKAIIIIILHIIIIIIIITIIIINSLHVTQRRNFWYLNMASTKLFNWFSMNMSPHSVVSNFLKEISIIVILIFCLNIPVSKCP